MDIQSLPFEKGLNFSFLVRRKKIFIIHGHHDKDLTILKTMLYDFGAKPIVLTESQDFNSDTLIEKLEKEAKRCNYALALCTPDDLIEKKGKKYYQVRPNVLYEIGWFCGKFGRDKILVVKKEGTELFSDFNGVGYVLYKENLDETLPKLFRALRKAKIIN